ncbi:3' exoribonuclease family, domain 1-domain-containing protein [Mycena albidolilacea]|uniref:3' exoribonuclease family, domain 1-domain-containing protein n=1 Tax=Mycena albidolilacea TaxID=1033008 RepID=A0AAD6ZXD0_9AGAR|nr:3' exoribonuclease family, domain 1-domain-containing protein [Mycena albidolilacea]
MAFALDRRRINGPEDSFPPSFDLDASQWKLGDPRKDRSPADIRSIFLQPGLISQANGSAYIETAKTKIACAVYGPRQSKNTTYSEMGRLNVEVKFTPFSCVRRRAPMRDAEDRSIAVAIHQALVSSVRLELLPKSTIDIFITIIESDGLEGCVASGSVAASTALADAGIELLGLVTSCAASVVGKEIWLDPTEEEARLAKGTVVVACMPALQKITSIWQAGETKVAEALACMDACQEKCTEIHSVVAQALLESAKI